MREFRLLRADEIECRISEIRKDGSGLSLLLYKTARTDAALLDEVVGPQNWQNDFRVIANNLYGGIGIKRDGEWLWRWDCGTESNTEAEKGQASDAFKRAGFKWGIGTELYSSPRISVPATLCKIKEYNGKYRCYDNFAVEEIAYDDLENISKLVIKNQSNSKIAYQFGHFGARRSRSDEFTGNEKLAETASEATDLFACEQCGQKIEPYTGTDGAIVTPAKHVAASKKKFGKRLCLECINENANRQG